jgi:uncharacterized protein (TIGR02117 family)
MKKKLKKIFIILLRVLLGFAGAIVLYIGAGFGLAWIPVNGSYTGSDKGIDVYIKSNGVHTDLVVPIRNELKDWRKELDLMHIKSKDTTVQYAGFGWGDKGFYLETPTWAELKYSTAFKALFYLSTTAMHVTYHKELVESESCRKVTIDKERYLKLISYIESSFANDSNGQKRHIPNHSYGQNDCFYEANGTYNLFYTCNTWANEGLKQSGLKACLWTPFDKGILWQYDK